MTENEGIVVFPRRSEEMGVEKPITEREVRDVCAQFDPEFFVEHDEIEGVEEMRVFRDPSLGI